MSKPVQPLPFAATRKALAEALAEIDGLLPGSVVVRRMRCGKRNCAWIETADESSTKTDAPHSTPGRKRRRTKT